MNNNTFLKCEDEPIHIPGSIQPIGYLMAINKDSKIIEAISENIYDISLLSKILGRNIAEFIPAIDDYIEDMEAIRNDVKRNIYFGVHTSNLLLKIFDVFISYTPNDKNMILELVPKKFMLHIRDQINFAYDNVLHKCFEMPSTDELFNFLTHEIRKLTGYDRVMIYKFDDDYNGQVVAESKQNSLNSYLGLHFPASDIPKQARDLYITNTIRIIGDSNYEPSKLLSLSSNKESSAYDLSNSFLRSVSPFHIQYMKNMGVKASMTISLVIDNKLWGLISCHNQTAYTPSMESVNNSDKLSKTISMLVKKLEEHSLENAKNKFLGNIDVISVILRNKTKNFETFDFENELELLKNLFDCDGFIYVAQNSISTIAVEADVIDTENLVSSIKKLDFKSYFETNEIGSCIKDCSKKASKEFAGIVVVRIKEFDSMFIWTRKERIQTINWGGNPDDTLTKMTMSPRQSFAVFTKTIKNKSIAWPAYTGQHCLLLSERMHVLFALNLSKHTNLMHAQVIQNLEEEKNRNFSQLIDTFVKMIEERDAYTAGHTLRVAKYCVLIGKQMGLNENELNLLEQSAKLHDIGKIIIPDSVLLKPGKLNESEYELIKLHLDVGYDILQKIEYYKPVAEIMKYHHERYDGSGYPYKLKGNEIPLMSSIMAVADSLDAMTSNRIYRKRKTLLAAIEEITSLSGKWYHPVVVDALNELNSTQQIDIEETSQIPLTKMELERFSYFFKESMTGFYNEPYLWMILNNHIPHISVQSFALIELHGMSKYNQLHGWHSGNILINNIAKLISKAYSNHLIFRVYGDDFAICFLNSDDVEDELSKWQDVKLRSVFTSIRTIEKSEFIQEMQLSW